MKKTLIILFCIFQISQVRSQTEFSVYSEIQKKISPYLDSISEDFYKEKEYYFSKKPEDKGFSKTIWSSYIFGENNFLLVAPNDSSKYKNVVPYFEKVFLPQYQIQNKERWDLKFCHPCGAYETDCFNFAFTMNGDFGFVHESDLFSSFFLIPETNVFFAENQKKRVLFNLNHEKSFTFNSSNYTISCDGRYLTYSIDDYEDSFFQSIYLFDFETWQNKKIAQGFSPTAMSNEIVYWKKHFNTAKPEELHIYNVNTKVDTIIYHFPDSITLCHGINFFEPGRIKLNSSESGMEIDVPFVTNSYIDDWIQRRIKLSAKGEIIEIYIKE